MEGGMNLPGWDTYRDSLACKLIRRWEGCRLTAYLCSAGYQTIGYGHVIRENGRMLTTRDPLSGMSLGSIEDAERLLRRDLPRYTGVVDRAAPGLLPHQSAALTSFVFNLGPGAFRSSTLLRKVLAEDWEAVPGQFRRWVFAGGRKLRGLVLRREAEARMFMGQVQASSAS